MRRAVSFNIRQFALTMVMVNFLVDPSNAVFGTKMFTLGFFVLINNFKISCSRMSFVSFFVSYLVFAMASLNMMTRALPFDNVFWKTYSTTFLFLILLFYTKSPFLDYYVPFLASAIIIAIATIILRISISISPEIGLVLGSNARFASMFYYTPNRALLGLWIPALFHMSSPILIIAFAVNFLRASTKHDLRAFFLSLMFAIAIMISGTRANIFGLGFEIAILTAHRLWRKKRYGTLIFSVIAIAFLGIVLTTMLLGSDDSSTLAKMGSGSSIIQYISDDANTFFFGMGPGSYYYSEGYHRDTTISELSYLELLRMFGLLGFFLLMAVFLGPLAKFSRNKGPIEYSIFTSYIVYLMIAGTNPLLIGPTGFSVLALVTYMTTKNKHRENMGSCLLIEDIEAPVSSRGAYSGQSCHHSPLSQYRSHPKGG